MTSSYGLLTDFYELTMMQGYYLNGHNPPSVFEMFFRKHPFGGGFTIAAGLETLLRSLESIRFTGDDISYLDTTGLFREEFLEYLSTLSFTGDVYAVEEGEIVFPCEPLVRVHAPLIEAQWVESIVLNTINFQTLIATKTARICRAAGDREVIDFGLRRSHGPDGALTASRAAYIGGVSGTSNTLAGKIYAIPVRGTMAHSWVMAFGDEKDAFAKYSQVYPDGAILLIDTIDTLGSGLPHAIEVGKKLKKQGALSFGVRLDSGDLGELSKKVREELDAAGLPDAKIVASNDLDEYAIEKLASQGAPIDAYGVGTRLITAYDDPALGGVYKLIAVEKEGNQVLTMKVSDEPEKNTLPGIKQVYRFFGKDEEPLYDQIVLTEEPFPQLAGGTKIFRLSDFVPFKCPVAVSTCKPLLNRVMKGGELDAGLPGLDAIREKRETALSGMPIVYLRLDDPKMYTVSISSGLNQLRKNLNP